MQDLTIPRRIRQLREDRQLAGYQLAKMAGISPSYLSLIESGQKLPSVEVAERLAKALGEDPEVYRAWVETADEPDLDARQTRLEKLRAVQIASSPPGTMLHRRGRRRVRELVDGLTKRVGSRAPQRLRSTPDYLEADEASAGIAESDEALLGAQYLEAGAPAMDYMPLGLEPTVHVPLIKEGTDPDRLGTSKGRIEETIAVDRCLLDDDQDPGELFAYRVTSRTIDRVHNNPVLPGDILIFAANPEGVDSTAVYAVRMDGKIVLSRIARSGPNLLLTHADHSQELIQIDVGNEDGLYRRLAGVVVTGIRRWAKPKSTRQRGPTLSLGRTGRFEDGSIVRDCEWKENYGWRPVQRAEDLDYLDAHPGSTVRFPLIRDGKVKYVLEMDAGQWREALGDYYEGPTWRRNGYIVAITKRVRGEYTEKFQERWEEYVRKPRRSER